MNLPAITLPELRFATNKQEKRKVDREENKQTKKQTMKVSDQAYPCELEWDNRRIRKRPFGFRRDER